MGALQRRRPYRDRLAPSHQREKNNTTARQQHTSTTLTANGSANSRLASAPRSMQAHLVHFVSSFYPRSSFIYLMTDLIFDMSLADTATSLATLPLAHAQGSLH